MFFNKRCSFEQLLTSLASEFTLVLLFDVRFNCFGQLPVIDVNKMLVRSIGKYALLVAFTTIMMRFNTISIEKQGELRVKPVDPALIYDDV